MEWLALVVLAYFVGVVSLGISLGRDHELLDDMRDRMPFADDWSIPAAFLLVALSWPALIPAICFDRATQVRNWWRARRALRRAHQFEDALLKKMRRPR